MTTGRYKRIEDISTPYRNKTELEKAEKHNCCRWCVRSSRMTVSVRQPRSLGLGHAVLCAGHLVGNGSRLRFCWRDDLMVGFKAEISVMAQMAESGFGLQQSILAVQEGASQRADQRYGSVAGEMVGET
jgi:UTP--glucose-1-phosphate uridylyltransferase